MRWDQTNATLRFSCCVCERTWASKSRQSRCSGCNIVYHPIRFLGEASKIVRSKDETVEQLHLGM